MSDPRINIVVAGDIIVDHHIYEGKRLRPATQGRPGVRIKTEAGGAAGLHRLLARLMAPAGAASAAVHLGTQPPATTDQNGSSHAFAVWRPFPRHASEATGAQVWRTDRLMGYGDLAEPTRYTPHPAPDLPPIDILMLDDGGQAFRRREYAAAWLLPDEDGPKPRWIVLKTAGPVCQGDLWYRLVRDHASRLVCLVSARDLRREHVRIGGGLSWERTVEDLWGALEASPALAPLKRCRHLVVTFSADAALWLDRPPDGSPRATLCYDPGGFEGAFAGTISGQSIGYLTGMAASIVRELAFERLGERPDGPRLADAAKAGLSAMRLLLEEGHGEVGGPAPDGFPAAAIAAALLGQGSDFADIPVPWSAAAHSGRTLSLVEVCQRPLDASAPASLLGLARQVVIQGLSALDRLPHARFGRLVTAQREEIEALRNIRAHMVAYREARGATKPLSIGVFGPPGAGKSFGVKEVANAVFDGSCWLEFNLSQFEGQDELLGAFHQARDLALAGKTPVVFWDEFDCREYDWLQYLLAPMQDGRFQEGQLTHAIGRGVFVFAGGTSPSHASFCSPDPSRSSAFAMKKGPDFCSRLDAYYDVLGPNQRRKPAGKSRKPAPVDPADQGYQLRRALFIRGKLAASAKERLSIDPDLLDALLLVPDYRHGARSLEKLLAALRPVDGAITLSCIPPPLQLDMYVDAGKFAEIVERNAEFRMTVAIEELAAAIHARWLALPDRNRRSKPHLDRPYHELGLAEQEDNRDAARRIPEVLALVGLGVSRDPTAVEAGASEVKGHLERHLELLAEAVHDGWMGHKVRAGWRYAKPRDDRRRLHDALVPYKELEREDRDKDRHLVLAIPELVGAANFRIVWL